MNLCINLFSVDGFFVLDKNSQMEQKIMIERPGKRMFLVQSKIVVSVEKKIESKSLKKSVKA